MTNEEILESINNGSAQKQNIVSILLLVISAVLFVGLGGFRWSINYVLMLAVAIFIHEFGHLLAMRLFKYKNLKMLFLPFLGGMAMGDPDEHDALKIAVISLFGPLTGLVSAYVALWIGTDTGIHEFYYYAYLALLLNALNLLPVLPLDGGHYLNEAVLSRSPFAELVFKLIAVVCLIFFAVKLQSFVFGILAYFMLIVIKPQYALSRAIKDLRADQFVKGDRLDIDRVDRIRARLALTNPILNERRSKRMLPNAINNAWNGINKKFPSVAASFTLVSVYLVILFIVVPVSFVVVVEASKSAGVDWSRVAG